MDCGAAGLWGKVSKAAGALWECVNAVRQLPLLACLMLMTCVRMLTLGLQLVPLATGEPRHGQGHG